MHFIKEKLPLILWTITALVGKTQAWCISNVNNWSYYNIICSNVTEENFQFEFLSAKAKRSNGMISAITISDSNLTTVEKFKGIKNSICWRLVIYSSNVHVIEKDVSENMDGLQFLDLSKNYIKDLSFLNFFPNKLDTLILAHNKIEEVPHNLFKMFPNLQLLDMSNCNIKSVYLVYDKNVGLPCKISLSNNSISNITLTDFYGSVSTLTLDISYNKMTNLTSLLSSIPGVKTLNVSNNLLRIVEKNTFEGISNLNLSNNSINSIEKDAFEGTQFTVLDLSFNQIRTIRNGTFSNANIETLKLSRNRIQTIQQNAFVFQSCNNLDLSSNKLVALKDYSFNKSQITLLDFSQNSIETIQKRSFSGATVDTLILRRNKLSSLKKSIDDAVHVTSLDLSFNPIITVENYFVVNSYLKNMNLSNCQIKVVEDYAFANITNIQQIDLSNNFLKTINNFLTNGLPTLSNLNVENNKITHLKPLIFYNSSLTRLGLKRNDLVVLENDTFRGVALTPDNGLLDLTYCNIQEIDYYAFNLSIAPRDSYIETINLSQNSNNKISSPIYIPDQIKTICFSTNSSDSLASFLKSDLNNLGVLNITFNGTLRAKSSFNLANLEVLNIINSNISLEKYCFIGLQQIQQINFFNVQVNSIEPGAFLGLYRLKYLNFRLLFENVSISRKDMFLGLASMSSLNLSDFKINGIEKGLFNGLDTLTELLLNNNAVTDLGSEIFSNLGNLRILNLSSNAISQIDQKAFSGLSSLTKLDLSKNEISDLDENTFLDLSNLIELYLEQNQIDKIGIGLLRNTTSLQKLNLKYNRISRLEFGVFSRTTSLNVLELSYNKLEILDQTQSANALFSLGSLNVLSIEGNGMSNYVDYELLLRLLSGLRQINLNNNNWNCKDSRFYDMLLAFRSKNINYKNNVNYSSPNLDGILCNV